MAVIMTQFLAEYDIISIWFVVHTIYVCTIKNYIYYKKKWMKNMREIIWIKNERKKMSLNVAQLQESSYFFTVLS